MDDLAGCRLADRAPATRAPVLRFTRPWGPFAVDDELALPVPTGGDLGSRGVRLRASDADTVAVDQDGHPALVVVQRGSGTAVTCAYPVETLLAATPDAHGPDDQSWGLYAGLAAFVRTPSVASCEHPDVTLGELRGPAGGVIVATNHSGSAIACAVRPPQGSIRAAVVRPTGISPLELSDDGVALELDAYDASVLTWRRELSP
jgi:hypothetical protein